MIRQKCHENSPIFGSMILTIKNNFVFKQFSYSSKSISLIPEARITIEAFQKRYQYAIDYNQLMPERDKLIFINEMGLKVWSRRSGDRAPKGVRADKYVKQFWSRNYSICVAMRCDSLYFFEIQDISNFFQRIFSHSEEEGLTGAHIFMDNVSLH